MQQRYCALGVGLLVLVAGCGGEADAPVSHGGNSKAAAKANARDHALFNEVLVLDAEAVGKGSATYREGYALQLSPDGANVLYMRQKDSQTHGSCNELVLRDVAGGKETVLPTPLFGEDDKPGMMLMHGLFDPAGTRIILGVGVDASGDGVFRDSREKMQLMVYDTHAGKMVTLPFTADLVAPLGFTADESTVLAAGKLGGGSLLREMNVEHPRVGSTSPWNWAGFYSPNPVAPLIPVAVAVADPRDAGTGKWPTMKPHVYDYREQKFVAALPLIPSLEHRCHWTPDGRYLCYASDKGAPQGADTAAHVWDRETQNDRVLAGGSSVGCGPGDSTVLVVSPDGKETTLYDVSYEKPVKLGQWSVRAIWAVGKHVVYVKRQADGAAAIYRAEMPPVNE